MSNVLIVYGSGFGQTAAVVQRLGGILRSAGAVVTVWKGDDPVAEEPIDRFDAVLVAGSVRLGRHQPYLEAFVKRHVGRLNQTPSAFVSVCGALGGDWPEGPAHARQYVDRFLNETGWHPREQASFAGAIRYTRYGLITRWMMQLVSWRTGRPTDASRDWEFTDWEAVDRFGEHLASSFAMAPA
jgi:menaquinone-dependent protoporphyrinogen oxidase